MAGIRDDEDAILSLYRNLIDAWNRRDAAAFAELLAEDGHVVGFDGSQMDGRAETEKALAAIFASHATGGYVSKVRGVDFLGADAALLRAVAGMVPAGASELKPELNAVQSLVARRPPEGGRWRIALFQNTPAQFHGRPELAEALSKELASLVNMR
jgi:uncharacterized protein (TIGR02246 family)